MLLLSPGESVSLPRGESDPLTCEESDPLRHGGDSGDFRESSSLLEREELDDSLSFGEQTASELFDRGESVTVRRGESFSCGESFALAAGEWDPLERGESLPLERFLFALERGDSLPRRRGDSLPRRRGESLLLLLGDPDDLLKRTTTDSKTLILLVFRVHFLNTGWIIYL